MVNELAWIDDGSDDAGLSRWQIFEKMANCQSQRDVGTRISPFCFQVPSKRPSRPFALACLRCLLQEPTATFTMWAMMELHQKEEASCFPPVCAFRSLVKTEKSSVSKEGQKRDGSFWRKIFRFISKTDRAKETMGNSTRRSIVQPADEDGTTEQSPSPNQC